MPEALAPESVAAPEAAPIVTAEVPGSQETGEAVPEAAKPAEPARTFTQDDIDRIVTKRLSKAERAWARERQQLLDTALGAQRQQQPAPQSAASGDERPDPAKFTDFQSYMQAEINYAIKQDRAQGQRAAEAAGQEAQTRDRQSTIAAGVQKKFALGAEKYNDFEDVVGDPDLPITATMAEVLVESDLGEDLAYYLGKNPKEAARIAALSPLGVARELGKLEAKLPTLKLATSKAPAPVSTVRGAAGGEKDPSTMSDAEFNAWRKRQIAARGGR